MPVLSFPLDEPASMRCRERAAAAAARFWGSVGDRDARNPASPATVNGALERYHAGLGAAVVDGGLVVDTGGARELRPWVDWLLGARPPGARLHLLGRRPPVPVDGAAAAAGVDPRRVRVRVGFSRGHLVQVVITAPEFGGLPLEEAGERALGLCLDVLGEALFDDWVEAVHGAPGPRGTLLAADPRAPSTLSLGELLPAVEAARAGVLDGLPDAPHARRAAAAPWTLLTLEPSAERTARQRDRLSAATWVPELLRGYLSGAPFSSCRFSRHGELFASLSWPRSAPLEEAVAVRDRVAERTDAALAPAALGCVVGHGVGLERVYLDVCLGPPAVALPVALVAWRGAGAPAGATLAFLDDDLAAEGVTLSG